MNVNEKTLLIQLLLEDIRGNWGHGWGEKTAEERALKAKSLCEEIASELNDDNYITLSNSCNKYIECSKIWGDWDGRWFRTAFPEGYEGMDNLHGLKPTYMDKSDEFKLVAEEYLTYPDNRFDDWEDYINS